MLSYSKIIKSLLGLYSRYYAEVCNDQIVIKPILRSLAPGQHSSEKTSQRLRSVGDTVSDLTDPGFKPQTSRADINVVATELTGRHNYQPVQPRPK